MQASLYYISRDLTGAVITKIFEEPHEDQEHLKQSSRLSEHTAGL